MQLSPRNQICCKQGLKTLHTWHGSAHNTNRDFSRYKWRTVPSFLSFASCTHFLSLGRSLFVFLPLFCSFFDKLSTGDLDLNTHFGGITKITIDEVNQQEHVAKTLAANTHELILFYWVENVMGIRSNKDGWRAHNVGFSKCTKTLKMDSGWQRYAWFGGGCISVIYARKWTQTHKIGWGKLSN